MTLNEALQIKENKRLQAEAEAEKVTKELYALYPEIELIDQELAAFGPALVSAAVGGRVDEVKQMEKDNLALQDRRAAVLVRNGKKPDEDAPQYECAKCKDYGYTGNILCECTKKLLSVHALEASGLGKGLSGKTFDNFSMKYYTGEDRVNMEKVLEICRKYASQFSEESPSLLFLGKTGLGKTHLSAAIAGVVAAKGYSVVYESAQKLFDTYELSRFGKDPDSVERVGLYENCDLLIVDDLGTECASPYTAANFFALLNLRLVNGKAILINTNLKRPEIEKNYGERTLSRLFGDFKVLLFKGQDVREQKIKENV